MVSVEGPKGKLSQEYIPEVEIVVADGVVTVARKNESKQARAFHGLYRNLVNNMVIGVSQGFKKTLVINGVGYRAEVQGNFLVMSLGYSSDFMVVIPQGLAVAIEANGQKVLVSGADRALLGKFASRTLKPGKSLCLYVDKRHLPQAMARLSGAGLTYLWSCAAFRPADKAEVPDMLVREKWRLLLIYRKGEASESTWDWFEDSVECRQPSNRDLARQLIKGLTIPGQVVVDPLAGSGITGQMARSLERRFLCFGADEADVQAANQRIAQIVLTDNIIT
jgi:large subunit ribosomal protein L6